MISFETIAGALINMFAVIYVWHKLINKKIDYKDIKLYIAWIIMSAVSIGSYYALNPFIKIFVFTLCIIIIFKIYFKESIKTSILTVIFEQMEIMISEFIFAIIITLLFKMNSNDIVNTQFGSLLANFFITMIAIGIVNFPFVVRFYKFIIRITDKIKYKQLILLSLFVLIVANVLAGALYFKLDFIYLTIFNTLITLFCFLIVLYSFKTKNSYNKVYDKYNTTLNSLKEYEDILDKYRVSNHENKNQLLTIRNMVSKTDKEVIGYIDTVIENKLKDNDKVMLEAAKIPAGGLRGLIYSKLLLMKNLKISYDLEISNDIKTVDLINRIDDSTMLDICKIIGVYLDNSIEAVSGLKDRYINIEMYIENKSLIIAISNNYMGVIDLNVIEEKGYSSKGKGHGYGLSLTREIIDNNNKLQNEKKISKEVFTQMLKIKM